MASALNAWILIEHLVTVSVVFQAIDQSNMLTNRLLQNFAY